MKLIDEWRHAWKFLSVHALVLAGAIPAVWAELPEDLKSSIPPGAMSTVTVVIAICGIAGRLVSQSKNNDS